MTIIKPRWGQSYVDWLTWPAAGGLNVLLLSDQELHIVQALTYPRSGAYDCAVTPIGDARVETLVDDDLLDFRAVADDLQVKLTGGVGMDVAALLAAQVAAMTPWGESYENLTLPAGDSVQNWTAVPAGTIRFVRGIRTLYLGTPPVSLATAAYAPGLVSFLQWLYSPASGQRYIENVDIILKAGYYLRNYVYGATAGDNVYLSAWGYDLVAS